MERAGDVYESLLDDTLHAGSAIRKTAAFGGLDVDRLVRRARRPEQVQELRRIRSRGRGLKLEVLRSERERAVRRPPDELAHAIGHRRPAVRGESHHLVLILVHGEAQIGREGRIEHAERVREPDLAQKRDVRAIGPPFAVTGGQRRPFPYPIGLEDGRTTYGRGEKCRGSVRLMMSREEDLLAADAEMRRDDAAGPDLFPQRVLHRVRKGPPRARERAKRAREDPREL